MLTALPLQIAHRRSRESYKYLLENAYFSSAAVPNAEFCVVVILSLYSVAWTFGMKRWEANTH